MKEIKVVFIICQVVIVCVALDGCFWFLNQPSNALVVVGALGIALTVALTVNVVRTRCLQGKSGQTKGGDET